MQPYFSRIPNIVYNNLQVKDITRRAKLVENEASSPYVFYPYDVDNHLRSDQVASYYYDDPELDWLIYLSNGIVDPYYGWYLDEEKFNELMITKYGSIENSIKKIKFYRNNWANDDTELTPAFYNNTLINSWKKYYSPMWATNSKIVSYRRKQQDATMNTNRILEYSVSYNNLVNFNVGEVVDIKIVGQTSTTGGGQVTFANSTVLRIESVSGNTTANSTYTRTIVGETSGANVTTNAVSIVFENITANEEVFWSPVSFYDYETEKNEQRKSIRLVADSLSSIIVNDFTQKLSENG